MLRRQLGNIVLDRIVESESADPFFDPVGFFPETTPEQWEPYRAWTAPRVLDPVSGKLILAVQSFLVRTRHHTLLVDTCVGDGKPRSVPSWNMTTSGRFLADLAAAGVGLCVVIAAPHGPVSVTGLALATLSGAIASGMAYAAWYAVLPSLPSWRAATIQLAVPVLTAVAATVILTEPVTARLTAAMLLVVTGIWCTTRSH